MLLRACSRAGIAMTASVGQTITPSKRVLSMLIVKRADRVLTLKPVLHNEQGPHITTLFHDSL